MRGDELDIDDAETIDGVDPRDHDEDIADAPDDGRMKKRKRDDRMAPHSRERQRTTVPKVRGRES